MQHVHMRKIQQRRGGEHGFQQGGLVQVQIPLIGIVIVDDQEIMLEFAGVQLVAGHKLVDVAAPIAIQRDDVDEQQVDRFLFV